jgi:CheY-like chemotaxis protein
VKSTSHARVNSNVGNPRATMHRASILYAEDDQLVRNMITTFLQRGPYEITPVENGLVAWESMQTTQFDLLITDNDMPRLTGIELITKCRRKGITLPIILASGSAGFFSGEEYRWLDLSACLQKPFAPSQLLTTVELTLSDWAPRPSAGKPPGDNYN